MAHQLATASARHEAVDNDEIKKPDENGKSNAKKSTKIAQYKIMFIHCAKDYDTVYVPKKYFQELFRKYNLSVKPYNGDFAGKIIALALVNKGFWFDTDQKKLDFAWGPYMYSFLEVLRLQLPMDFSGKENNGYLNEAEWKQLCSKNTLVTGQIQLWKTMYHKHLQRFNKYGDIPVRSFKMPWAILDYFGIKSVENQPSNCNHKIDSDSEDKYCDNVRCRGCIDETDRCKNCLEVQKYVNRWKPK